tara:strand:- start:3481 stop:3921 length:441 start_codon:yes stop_codon:yes gene_type:complete
MATNYIYKQKNPDTGEDMDRVGMITIFNDSEMHRVPDGAIEVGEAPVEEDPEGAYFDAWRLQQNGTVKIDLEAAKEIRLKYLKKRRSNLLERIDQLQFRAHCSDDKEEIQKLEKTKNELRDFPDKINWNVIHNLNDVKHILPPCLI